MNEKEKQANDYAVIDLGAFSNLTENVFKPNPDFKIYGKRFVKEELGLTSSEISFNTMQANTAMPFLHKHHENEEIYIGIKGKGQMLLNDNYVDLKEGTAVRVATGAKRAVRNNSNDLFSYIVI